MAGFVVGDGAGQRRCGGGRGRLRRRRLRACGGFGLTRGREQAQLLLLLLLRELRLELPARAVGDEQLVLHRLRLGVELGEELVGIVLRGREMVAIAFEIRMHRIELVDRRDVRGVGRVEQSRRAPEVEQVVSTEEQRAGDRLPRADVRPHRDLLRPSAAASARDASASVIRCWVSSRSCSSWACAARAVSYRAGRRVGGLLRGGQVGPGSGQIVTRVGVRGGRDRPHEHHQQQQDARATATKGHPGGKG